MHKNFLLSWWEGIKARGIDVYSLHPHPNPPPSSRGRAIQGYKINYFDTLFV